MGLASQAASRTAHAETVGWQILILMSNTWIWLAVCSDLETHKKIKAEETRETTWAEMARQCQREVSNSVLKSTYTSPFTASLSGFSSLACLQALWQHIVHSAVRKGGGYIRLWKGEVLRIKMGSPSALIGPISCYAIH